MKQLLQLLILVTALLALGACSAPLQSVNQLVGLAGTAGREDGVASGIAGAKAAASEVPMINTQAKPIDKSSFKKAAEISSPVWINSKPLDLKALKGKVVVVDFWTFACYNCKNTLPYFKDWDKKYRDQGLVIVGVHTPELSIERDIENVKQAVKDYEIQYPVAIDGDYSNWNRYNVWAWPTWYIVDKEGYIRYSHVGEGDYAASEATIQKLLAE